MPSASFIVRMAFWSYDGFSFLSQAVNVGSGQGLMEFKRDRIPTIDYVLHPKSITLFILKLLLCYIVWGFSSKTSKTIIETSRIRTASYTCSISRCQQIAKSNLHTFWVIWPTSPTPTYFRKKPFNLFLVSPPAMAEGRPTFIVAIARWAPKCLRWIQRAPTATTMSVDSANTINRLVKQSGSEFHVTLCLKR